MKIVSLVRELKEIDRMLIS